MDEIIRHSGKEIKFIVNRSSPSLRVLHAVSNGLFVDGVTLIKIGFFLAFVTLMIEKHPSKKYFLCEQSLKILCERLKFE